MDAFEEGVVLENEAERGEQRRGGKSRAHQFAVPDPAGEASVTGPTHEMKLL